MRKAPEINDLLHAIDALGKELPKRPNGKGWYTLAQMAEEREISKAAMRARLATAIARGVKVERFVGSDYDPTGRLTKQTWLRVAK